MQASSGVVAKFMNGVYAWMSVGLCVTGIVALLTARAQVYPSGGLMILLVVAQIALVIGISRAISRLSPAAALGLFVLYAALNGLTLSFLFVLYTNASIAGAFLITAGMFGAMSVYGMTTKRDLTGIGGMLMMALVGIIIASVVNMFLHNSTLYWLISYVGVAIFVGLTAYDTQRLKQIAYQTSGDAMAASRLTVLGALTLYLDFINLLVFVLSIMGSRRND